MFLSFESKNTPIKFHIVMDHVLVGLDFAKCYIDDIIVFSSTIEEHGHPLQDMCECLGVHGSKLYQGKCNFFQFQMEYLHHVITQEGWESKRSR
jgi:hypothetical protein